MALPFHCSLHIIEKCTFKPKLFKFWTFYGSLVHTMSISPYQCQYSANSSGTTLGQSSSLKSELILETFGTAVLYRLFAHPVTQHTVTYSVKALWGAGILQNIREKTNEHCAYSDSDVGSIISTLCTTFQQVDCAVAITWVNECHTSKTHIRVGMNLAHEVVVRLIDLDVDHTVAQKLRLV